MEKKEKRIMEDRTKKLQAIVDENTLPTTDGLTGRGLEAAFRLARMKSTQQQGRIDLENAGKVGLND